MASDSMWIKTHKALNDFVETLTCKKCQQKLSNPQQFLNCGHFACSQCIGSNTECVECKIPGEVSDIYSDSNLKDLILNLNIIAEAVGFRSVSSSVITNSEDDKKSIKRQTVHKVNKKKTLDETLNSSICESTISRNTQRGRVNIPKNINKKNKKGETALHIACRSNHVERVKELLDAGAIPNTKDHAGWTPLQEAANYQFHEVCEILLNAGASPDTPGCDSRTALHEAVSNDDCDLASLLINFNANRNVFDNVGKKPKDYCKSKKMSNIFQSLQDSADNKLETFCEPNKTSDFDKSLNQTNNEYKIVVYGSDLKPINRKLLAYLGINNKLKIANSLGRSVTHVILDTDPTNNIKLSFDVLFSIISGKWLLNSDCLSVFKDSENIVINDMDIFELNPPQLSDGPIRARENVEKQNPKLFNNCHFYFAIKGYDPIIYDDMSITKEQLMKLVSAGDGVTLTREPKPEDIQGSLSPFHVAHNSKHSLHKCTHYIIYVPESSNSHTISNRVTYNMSILKSLPLMWFVESILRFQLLDPIDLGISD